MPFQKGFSLVELLIVIVVTGIVAAISIPNLLASRRASNEASAIATLRTYHGAQAAYRATLGAGNFAGVPLVTNGFTVLANNGFMDSAYISGVRSGYSFTAHAVPAADGAPACHLGQAVPLVQSGSGQTGTRVFVIATEGLIHSAPTPATYAFQSGPGTAACRVNTAGGYVSFTD